MEAIEVRELTKRYSGTTVVDRLSFTVPAGRITGFLGPNGAGKTTTMRMILGLVTPDAGDALIEGRPFADAERAARTAAAALDPESFHPQRSARAHLRVLAAAARLPRGRVDEVLDLVDLSDAANKRVGAFSLGMRQRLALASALLGQPAILILDEPANGLDPAGIRWLRAFLRRYADAGNAVLVSSHLLSEVAEMADDVVVIDRGKLITHAPIRELTDGARSLEDVFFELTEGDIR